MRVAMTTGDLPKMVVTASGNWARAAEAWRCPRPGRRQAHDGGITGGDALGGDELHAGHGNGGEHRHGGPTQNALGNGGEGGGEFRHHTRQKEEGAGEGKDPAVDHLIGGHDTHILGISGRGQAAQQRRYNIGYTIGHECPPEAPGWWAPGPCRPRWWR